MYLWLIDQKCNLDFLKLLKLYMIEQLPLPPVHYISCHYLLTVLGPTVIAKFYSVGTLMLITRFFSNKWL